MVMGMANYIELKTAIDFIKNNTPTIDGMTTLGCVERALYNTPNADVVEVVRCKDCKCAYINSFSAASGVAVCKHWSNEAKTVIVQQDDFCSYGERKDNEGKSY